MADNYLEKQMEQYQARKAAWERERKLGKTKKKSSPKRTQQPSEPMQHSTSKLLENNS